MIVLGKSLYYIYGNKKIICYLDFAFVIDTNYTAFHKYIPDGISGCRKKRSNNGTFF